MSYYDLTANLFLQIAIIITTCRVVVFIGKRYLGQTEVVCEMLAGIILGPSIFGFLFPHVQQFVFPNQAYVLANGTHMPNQSMTLLFALSQIGVVLYMFLTGLEFRTSILFKHLKSVIFICSFGVIIPFLLGVCFILLINTNGLIVNGVSMNIAAIFFGAAISITAFPVLSRILDETHLMKTSLGMLALISGSLEDVVAWCMVALVLTITQHDPIIIMIMLLGTILYVVFMILMGYFLRAKFSNHFHEDLTPSKQILSFILIMLMLCAVAVDKIGLYSAFGAFIAGAVMPKGRFSSHIKSKFNYLTVSFLLPIFFTFTGLNTTIGLINTPTLWLITLLVIFLAIISKFVICTLAAHALGINWRISSAYGVLMNTRGLMELIILNIGLQQGIITLTLFTMMVIMTLITTMMASPLVNLIMGKVKRKSQDLR